MADTIAAPPPHLLAIAAVVASAGWLVLLWAAARATRTPPVEEAPGGEPGPHSPALVDLLTGGWRLCDREAAPATLLDLAARGFVDIEEAGPEGTLVGPRPAGRLAGRLAELTPYERMVFDHVRSLASGGKVPASALAEGPRDLKRWWRRFQGHVVAESRHAGFTRSRWSGRWLGLLRGAAALPAATVALLFGMLPADGPNPVGGVVSGVVAWFVLVFAAGLLNGDQGTAEGARVAGQWLGVRRRLAEGGEFADTPAAGVAVWGRRLAYAAALGLAGRASGALPVSRPADDGKAWSDHGGTWHVVRVRYPGLHSPTGHHLRLLRGRGRVAMAVVALALGMVAFVLTAAALSVTGFAAARPPAAVIPPALVVAGLAAVAPLVLGIVDHFSPQAVEGQVVRLRRYENMGSGRHTTYCHWVAIDDGGRAAVSAYGIGPGPYASLAEGDLVRLHAGRLLRTADHVEVLRPSRHRRGAAAAPVSAPDHGRTRPPAATLGGHPE